MLIWWKKYVTFLPRKDQRTFVAIAIAFHLSVQQIDYMGFTFESLEQVLNIIGITNQFCTTRKQFYPIIGIVYYLKRRKFQYVDEPKKGRDG